MNTVAITQFQRSMLMLALIGSVLFVPGVVISEQVTIRFHYRGGYPARVETGLQWIAEFERENPDIRVEWDPASSGSLSDSLIVSLAAGVGPDVIETYGPKGQELAQSGFYLDLKPYIANDFSQEDIDDFIPSLWDTATIKFGPYKGQQMSIPRYSTTTAFYFNKNLFDSAGLANPVELELANNWNWDVLKDTAKKLTIIRSDDIVQRGFSISSVNGDRFTQWLQAAGGDFVDPNDPASFIGDQPEAALAANFLQDLIWSDLSTSVGERDLFIQGRIGLLDEGMHALFELFDAEIRDQFEWDVVRRPDGPVSSSAYLSYDAFAISANTEHPEESWRFLKFLVSKEGQMVNLNHQGLPPSRISVINDYVNLDSDKNLMAYLQNALNSTVPLSGRIPGTAINQLFHLMDSAINQSIRRNTKEYIQAIQEVKPIIEGLLND